MTVQTTHLALRPGLMDFLEVYRQHMDAMQRGFSVAIQARASLGELLEPAYHHYAADRIQDLQRVQINDVRRRAWRWLLANSGVELMLSNQRLEAFEENLRQHEVPDPTPEAVMELLLSLDAQELLREMFEEAFDYLRPGKSRWSTYKTNEKARWRVPEKVILSGAVENGYGGGFRVSRWAEPRLRVVDRAFHALDGRLRDMESAYKSPLVDAIQTGDGRGETDYFRFRCFRNGNLHLRITRDDLRQELNRIAGEGRMEIGDG